MTEQEKHVNHFLTLFIGECWHEPKIPGIKIRTLTCSLCGYEKELFDNKQWHFDFYTPNDFFHLRKWMEKNEAELWEEYIGHIITANRDNPKGGATVNAILNTFNLYEFLKEHREEWGYIDTHIGNMVDGKIVHRDIHPAAKYLDSIKEG